MNTTSTDVPRKIPATLRYAVLVVCIGLLFGNVFGSPASTVPLAFPRPLFLLSLGLSVFLLAAYLVGCRTFLRGFEREELAFVLWPLFISALFGLVTVIVAFTARLIAGG